MSCAATTDSQAILAGLARDWALHPNGMFASGDPEPPPVWHLVSRTGLAASTSNSIKGEHAVEISKWSGYALAFIAFVLASIALWTLWTKPGMIDFRFKPANPPAGGAATASIVAAAFFIAVVTAERSGSFWLPLAIAVLVMMPWTLWRYIGGLAWQTLLAWICVLAALLMAVLFPFSLLWQPIFAENPLSLLLGLILQQVSLSWEGGVAYYSAVCIAMLAFLLLFIMNIHAAQTAKRNFDLLDRALGTDSRKVSYQSAIENGSVLLGRPCILTICILAAVQLWHLNLHGTRLTPFGSMSDATMLIALFILTALGVLFLATAAGKALGILNFCRLVLASITSAPAAGSAQAVPSSAPAEQPADDTAKTEPPLEPKQQVPSVSIRYSNNIEQQPDLLPTPVLAWTSAGGPLVTNLQNTAAGAPKGQDQWAALLGSLLGKGETDDRTFVAAFGLLAGEISLVQNAIFGVTLTTLAATRVAYAFPVTDGDGLLLINLATLTLTGLFAGFITMRFETDKVLSGILCNRDEKATFTLPLFGYVAFPFAILAVAIAIADIPGVLNWSGSIFGAILEFTKPAPLH